MQLRGRKHVATVGGAVAVALLAACSSSSSSSSSSTGATSAPAATSSSAAAAASGTLNGAGSTFQLTFQQAAISAYKSVASGVTVNYDGVGSGSGRADLYASTVNYAGSDSTIPSTEQAKLNGRKVLYFPDPDRPDHDGVQPAGRQQPQADPDADLANIFQAKITTWNDPAIKAVNPGVNLPSTPITLAVRSDSSGTTQNFTLFLQERRRQRVGARQQLAPSSGRPRPTPRAATAASRRSSSRRSARSATWTTATAQASGLTAASVENKAGKFVAPSTTAASAAAAGVDCRARTSPSTLSGRRPTRPPTRSPTSRGIIVYAMQPNANDVARCSRATSASCSRRRARRCSHRCTTHRCRPASTRWPSAAQPDHLVT